MNKLTVKQACLTQLKSRISELEKALKETQGSANDDTKSTAGDKHETSRAMAQIEVERLGQQLQQQLQQLNLLQSIPTQTMTRVEPGALVATDKGWFYFGIAQGQVKIEQTSIMTLGMSAPLSQEMLHKTTGEEASINGNIYHITGIF